MLKPASISSQAASLRMSLHSFGAAMLDMQLDRTEAPVKRLRSIFFSCVASRSKPLVRGAGIIFSEEEAAGVSAPRAEAEEAATSPKGTGGGSARDVQRTFLQRSLARDERA